MAVTAANNPFTKKRTAGIKQQEQPKKGGAWTDAEKSLFESAIVLLGWGNWLAFTDVISTRDNKQIKSHAQKWEKYHPKEKAQLIEEYEARKIVEASISTGINMAAESGDVASGGGSSSNGGGGTKKKKRVARRRGSLTKAKTPTPTTTRARRRSSAPGNIMVHQEQKLPSGGGAISKRRGSLRSSIRNSIKKSTSSTSSSTAKKSTTPTRKMSPEKNTKKTSSLSTSSHDIISSVTSRVSRVTLGEEPTTPPSNISTKCFNLMTPNAPTKQMVRNEEGETYDELAVLASTIYAPNSPDESTALASMVGNNVPYSPTDSSPGASSFNTTVAGQYDSNTCINMEDLVNELDLDLDLKSPPETPPTTKKEDVVPMKTEEGEEEIIEPLPVDGRNLASMVTIPDFLVNPKWNMVDSDDEEPLSNKVAVAASGPTNTQEPPPPPPPPHPCLHPDQALYTSIQMHIMSPPDFNNPKEYIQTEDGLSRMAMDTGRLCRVRIKALLTDHLDMGWWRENVSASGKGISMAHHQDELASFKKFGLERLIALTAIMLDINEWYTPNETAAAAAASFASNHAGQHFNDEDDIRHIGQLISGLWERVNLSLHRGGLAFLCNDPLTSTERMSAIDTAVAMLDWNSRREHFQSSSCAKPTYVCG